MLNIKPSEITQLFNSFKADLFGFQIAFDKNSKHIKENLSYDYCARKKYF